MCSQGAERIRSAHRSLHSEWLRLRVALASERQNTIPVDISQSQGAGIDVLQHETCYVGLNERDGPLTARGVFFAITSEQAAAFQAAADDDAVIDLVDEVEEEWDEDNLAECDKAWDALHRLLTDGALEYGNGPEPFCHCVLSPNQLHEGDDYIVSLVAPEKVKEVARALAEITQASFDERYRTVVPKDYALEYGDEDREYTWESFQDVRDLYEKAANRDRFMLFTVSQ